MPDADDRPLITAARQLLRGAFQGVLATHAEALPGYPLGSLVPYSLTPAGVPLLLLSHLAQHSRNLAQRREASLTLVDPAAADAQQQLRLCVVGDAEPVTAIDPALAARHFRYYPQARGYFEQLNFRFWQLQPAPSGYCAAARLRRRHDQLLWNNG